jgi:hypothetical protein
MAMMENTALRHVAVGTVFQLDEAPPHFSRCFRVFLDRELTYSWLGIGGPIPWPLRSPHLTSLDFFLLGVCRRQGLSEKV